MDYDQEKMHRKIQMTELIVLMEGMPLADKLRVLFKAHQLLVRGQTSFAAHGLFKMLFWISFAITEGFTVAYIYSKIVIK